MDSLFIKNFTDADILSEFTCGLQQMDDFIHHELQSYLDNEDLHAYYLHFGDYKVVAFIILQLCNTYLDNDTKDDLTMIYGINYKKEYCKSIKVEYLAVAKDFQHQGIGRDCINLIEDISKKITNSNDIVLITVEAFKSLEYSTIQFYEKCQFSALEYNNPISNTLYMYKPFNHLV